MKRFCASVVSDLRMSHRDIFETYREKALNLEVFEAELRVEEVELFNSQDEAETALVAEFVLAACDSTKFAIVPIVRLLYTLTAQYTIAESSIVELQRSQARKALRRPW